MLRRVVYYSFRVFREKPKQKQDMPKVQLNKLCKNKDIFFKEFRSRANEAAKSVFDICNISHVTVQFRVRIISQNKS